MTKTLVGINTLTAINQLTYANHIQFFFRLGRNYPDHNFALMSPTRMSIDRMRNFAVKVALESEFDYVMFIDDDVLVPFDAYGKLIAADKDIVAGNVVIRGYPYNNMVFKFDDDKKSKISFYNDFPEENLVACDAIGCSLVLIKCSLLQKLTPPYFVTGTHNTEDIYLCMKAQKEVEDVTIFIDKSIECGHVLGPQIVTPKNKHLWKKFEEDEEPSLLVPETTHGDRTMNYLEINGIK
jgi:hypothetical protein